MFGGFWKGKAKPKKEHSHKGKDELRDPRDKEKDDSGSDKKTLSRSAPQAKYFQKDSTQKRAKGGNKLYKTLIGSEAKEVKLECRFSCCRLRPLPLHSLGSVCSVPISLFLSILFAVGSLRTFAQDHANSSSLFTAVILLCVSVLTSSKDTTSDSSAEGSKPGSGHDSPASLPSTPSRKRSTSRTLDKDKEEKEKPDSVNIRSASIATAGRLNKISARCMFPFTSKLVLIIPQLALVHQRKIRQRSEAIITARLHFTKIFYPSVCNVSSARANIIATESSTSAEVTTTILLAESEKSRVLVKRTKTLTRTKSRGRNVMARPLGPAPTSAKLSTPSKHFRGSAKSSKSGQRRDGGQKPRSRNEPAPVIDEIRRETMTKELADLVRLATSPKSMQSVNLDDFIQSLKDVDGEWKPEEDTEAPKINRKKLLRTESFLHLKSVLEGLDVEGAIMGTGEEDDDDDDDDEEDDTSQEDNGSTDEDRENSSYSSDYSDSNSGYSYSGSDLSASDSSSGSTESYSSDRYS